MFSSCITFPDIEWRQYGRSKVKFKNNNYSSRSSDMENRYDIQLKAYLLVQIWRLGKETFLSVTHCFCIRVRPFYQLMIPFVDVNRTEGLRTTSIPRSHCFDCLTLVICSIFCTGFLFTSVYAIMRPNAARNCRNRRE